MALADLKLPPITFHKATHYTEGRAGKVIAFVNHRMVGTLAGTTSYFTNPETVKRVSTHFGIGVINGIVRIHQYVPLDDTAYGNGNYDASGNWDNWGFPTTNINARTISIEHQDHWGDDSLKGIVKPEVRAASQKLQALLRYGTIAEWKAAGLTFRNWTTNAPIIRTELDAIPMDGRHIITHHDISGSLKHYCWMPWARDTTGFVRNDYLREIEKWRIVLDYITPPTTITMTADELQAKLNERFAAGATSRDSEVASLNNQITMLNTNILTLQGENRRMTAKLVDIGTILDRA